MDDLQQLKITNRVGIKGNVRCITITDNVPSHWDSIIDIARKHYEFFAYIFHDSDEGVDKHIHILCIDNGGTSLKSHCARFADVVPSNFVEKVRSPRAMARYLIHMDQPEKFQYDRSLIVTNQPDRLAHFLSNHSYDIVQEFNDFLKLYNGEVQISEFLDKYRSEFSTMPFYQKQSLFLKLVTQCSKLPQIKSFD